MTKHTTGTREAWLAARLELLKAEKELTRRSDELARRRQELPWVRIDKRYRFETDEGSVPVARPGPQGARAGLLVAPPRRVRQPSHGRMLRRGHTSAALSDGHIRGSAT